MAVRAKAQITLAVTVDVQKVDTFYRLTDIGAAQPTLDTSTATPSGWSSTEPAYDSSKQLWTCQRTTLTDTAFYWGAVSKSSSYSGANAAWNKADGAQSTANSAVVESIPVYYRSTVQSAPNKPTTSTSIGTSFITSDAWEYKMPQAKRDHWFFTCEKLVHADGSVTFSDVRSLDYGDYLSAWCSQADSYFIDGGRIYSHSVTADKLATNSITIGKLADEVVDSISEAAQAAEEAKALSYDHSWTLSNGTYFFSARAWRGSEEITGDLPDDFFWWELRTETSTVSIGLGKTKSVVASSAGYRASVVGGVLESVAFPLVDSSSNGFVDESGNRIVGVWKA